jgi:hypothetical protein
VPSEVSFVRHRGRRDRIHVTRQDATTVSWDFPSYGDGLPHDLVHLVVEEALGIVDGFWGLVDGGVEVTLMDNQSTLVRHGRPLVSAPGFDASGLRRAEDAVALVAGMAPRPVGVSAAALTVIGRRLAQLGQQWRDLEDGAAITLRYGGGPGGPGPVAGEPGTGPTPRGGG